MLTMSRNIQDLFFSPLSLLYELLVSGRNKLYDLGLFRTTRVGLPVISVGNITVGGSGKTPFVRYLASELRLAGMRPVILSRGYGGRRVGPYQVTESDSPLDVGDEALMQVLVAAGQYAVVVSPDRVRGVEYILKQELGNVVLLDDGFQHRRLGKDLDLVLLDASDALAIQEVFSGKMLPTGRLREPLNTALLRADAIVLVMRATHVPEQFPFPAELGVVQRTSALGGAISEKFQKPVFRFILSPSAFVDVTSGQTLTLSHFHGQKGLAVCGIENPRFFFSMLSQLGVKIQEQRVYRDHHSFKKEELAQSTEQRTPLTVFATEKDAVKLSTFFKQGEAFSLRLQGKFFTEQENSDFLNLVNEVVNVDYRETNWRNAAV